MKKLIKVELINFPFTLGEGNEISIEGSNLASGCSVIQSMINNSEITESDLYFNSRLTYEIISKLTIKQLELCKCSPLCGPIIEKMQTNSYEFRNGKDDIQVITANDRYEPCEGKHRVCMAKNFKINEILVDLQ